MEKLKIVYKSVDDLIPYINNPRINDHAVDAVASSIKNFGFKVPIIIDAKNEIVAGHTRLKAAKKLGMKEVPTIVADDLDDNQIRAFRLADNKTAELAGWDWSALEEELAKVRDIKVEDFGFDVREVFGDEVYEELYTQKVETPVYNPTGEQTSINEMINTTKRDRLVREIELADIPTDISEFLKEAANRHVIFNYRKIAEYYAQADKSVQDLFEQSALVIIDYERAIELEFVKITDRLQELSDNAE
jgi:hypothetical protein